jgi:hypothetical protein
MTRPLEPGHAWNHEGAFAMGRLENKIAVITGDSRGQGAAHARRQVFEDARGGAR